MSLKLAAAVALLCAAVASATAPAMVTLSSPTFSVVEFSDTAGWGWRSMGRPDPSATITVTIAPKRTNMDELTRFAADVSNPQSAAYTSYKAIGAIAESTLPSTEAAGAIHAWLEGVEHSVNSITGVITAKLTIAQASGLFATTFRLLRHDETTQLAIVGDAVNVPITVAPHIEAVFGVHGLPLPPRQSTPASPATTSVTPVVIGSVYNVSGVTPSAGTNNVQAVAEFQGQLLSQSDLTTFFTKYVPHAPAGSDKVYKYVGDSQQGEGVEANLDIQYIMGVAPGIKTEAWQFSGQDFCSDMKQWTQQAISTSNHPNLFSVSYGWQGTMSSIGCSTSQIQSIDDDFKTMSAAGITIIFASGDSGSGYTSFFGQDAKLYSSWPASSEHVTAVGATTFIGNDPNQGQQAVTQFGSGGGFSRIVTPAPAWQSDAIKTFYTREKNAPKQSVYGYGGRGTPDVAALGENFQVVVNGGVQSVGGTSAAAPTFSAIVSLLNEARIQAGKAPLGNLNQWIYQNSDMLDDITQGNDRISRSGFPVPLGFDCEEGWDPVTGWGTPMFTKMLAAAMKA